MRLPIRNRGIAAGLAALAVAPAILVVSHLGGGPTTAARADLAPSTSPSTEPDRVSFSSKFAPVRDVAPLTETVAVDAQKVLPAPKPAASPAAPAPERVSYPPGSIQQIICDAANSHGVSCPWMVAIAQCESGLNPYASNGVDIGLFQFLPSTFRAHGGTDIYDPGQQSNIAADMLANGQSNAWPVCSKR